MRRKPLYDTSATVSSLERPVYTHDGHLHYGYRYRAQVPDIDLLWGAHTVHRVRFTINTVVFHVDVHLCGDTYKTLGWYGPLSALLERSFDFWSKRDCDLEATAKIEKLGAFR